MNIPKEVPGELNDVAKWHEEQAAWHRHSAEFDAADKIEPTRSMLLDGAAQHERFATSIRAAIAADRELRAVGGEPVAWQWRKRLTAGTYNGEPYLVWSEWEALQPPYMDARDLSKSDPENYEIRPLYLASPQSDARELIIAAGAPWKMP